VTGSRENLEKNAPNFQSEKSVTVSVDEREREYLLKLAAEGRMLGKELWVKISQAWSATLWVINRSYGEL